MTSRLCVAMVSAFTGCAVGYFLADDSSRVNELQLEIDKLKSELSARLKLIQVQAPVLRSSPVPSITTNSPLREVAQRSGPVDVQPELAQQEPERQKLQQQSHVAKTAAESSDAYAAVFSELRVGAENIELFQANLVQLHEKAIAAGDPLGELIKSRVAYDKNVRSVLGEDNYRVYRNYEESKPAAKEVAMIGDFASSEKRAGIDPLYLDTILSKIKESGATTSVTWHGPYDPLPRPAVGQEMVTNRMREDLIKLQEASARLAESLHESQVPVGTTQLVVAYYANKIRANSENLAFMSCPHIEVVKESIKQLKDELEARDRQRRLRSGKQSA